MTLVLKFIFYDNTKDDLANKKNIFMQCNLLIKICMKKYIQVVLIKICKY
jgi:hypothetical protein